MTEFTSINDDLIARFSVDGSYAVLDPKPTVGHKMQGYRYCVFYLIPSSFRSTSPPRSFTDMKVLQSWWHESGLSFRTSWEVCGDDSSVVLICLQVAKEASLERLPLTYVPVNLRDASFTVIVGESTAEPGKQDLQILFCMPKGGIELKNTNMTLLRE